jgi:hypothetical protein
LAKDIQIDEPKAPAPAASSPSPEQQQRQPVAVDASKAHAAYSNFCRVTGTPEELIIDFGLNTQPMGVPTEPIEISERIVMNYFTAADDGGLAMSLQRHERPSASGDRRKSGSCRASCDPTRAGVS